MSDKQVQAVKKLIAFFENQKNVAKALSVEQPTVSAWLNGKHGISLIKAKKAEKLTNGEVKAIELCPALAELEETIS